MIQPLDGRSGKVVTFYSYKGGVGRSFALANVAALLSRWRFNVLCIDWDIEAPGLEHYFATDRTGPGLVDMLDEWWSCGRPLLWREFLTETMVGDGAVLSLMNAGMQDDGYSRRAQGLDWQAMYDDGLGDALEAMVGEMRRDYDFILIDSRTGITDFGAIVTAQLPDILAFMFTANHQSLDGCVNVAERAALVRKSLPIERGALRLLPIVGRFEGRVEYSIAQEWRDRFYKRLQPFFSSWLDRDVDHRRIVDQTTIPHVPFWTFGERLAVVDEAAGAFGPDSISYSIETIAALIAKDLSATEVLAESRDTYVGSLQRREVRRREGVYNAYLSFAQSDLLEAQKLAEALNERGISSVGSDFGIGSREVSLTSSDQINRAQHLLVIVGREWGRWQDVEVRAFLHQSALDDRPRYLLPILLEPDVGIPRSLLSYKTIDLSDGVDRAISYIQAMIGGGPALA